MTAIWTSELTERKVSHFYVKYETTISVELLSFKLIFFAYFEEGMSASEAFHHHETLLMKNPVTHATADRRICPPLRDVNNLYEKWLVEKKGVSNASTVFDCLEEIVNYYNRNNADKAGKCYLQRVDRNGSAKHDLM